MPRVHEVSRNVGGRRHAGETGREWGQARPSRARLVYVRGLEWFLPGHVRITHLATVVEMSCDSRPLGHNLKESLTAIKVTGITER